MKFKHKIIIPDSGRKRMKHSVKDVRKESYYEYI